MAQKGRRASDEKLLLALACGATVENAARSAGVSERTAYRRLGDPAFQGAVKKARAEMVQRALGRLSDSATAAADALRRLLHAEAESVRLGAARSILELGTKLRDAAELEERLRALEERAANQGDAR